MIQSGHHERDADNGAMIAADYARKPDKPTLDGEPCYEDHPVNWKPELGHFEAWDVRKAAYRALFAGACGHTYGANAIFQFWKGDTPDPKFKARRSWEEALSLPGADQMQQARALMESHSFEGRVPVQSLVAPDNGEGADHAYALRGDGYAFIYIPTGRSVSVDLSSLGDVETRLSWFDPRTGETNAMDAGATNQPASIEPPELGPEDDWVLIVETV
jgi:hypothetical protein